MRRAAASLVLAAVAVLGAAAAGAQEVPPPSTDPPPDSSTSTTTTTPSTTTSLVPPVLPSIPPPPPTTAPVVDPDAGADAPTAPVPETTDTIPPREEELDPGSLPPPLARVVKVDVAGARAANKAAAAELEAATATRKQVQQLAASLLEGIGRLGAARSAAVANLAVAEHQLKQRAVDAYVRSGATAVPGFGAAATPDDIDHDLVEAGLLRSVLTADDRAVEAYDRARSAASTTEIAMADSAAKAVALLREARLVERQAYVQAKSTAFAVAVATAGGDFVIHGFVFPVEPPYSFTDTFGAPRDSGTDYAHWHMATDIAADEGQELLAAERGVITQISSGGLGGNGLWLRGESGTSYYYAHLSRYAEGLKVGAVVDAGELVGYVGSTGHSTGPHLHFEVHPNGGLAINPYPLLKAADPTASAR